MDEPLFAWSPSAWQKPGFTAAAVLVLALGIGANAAIFSLVNAFLLKPIAVHNPDELVGVYSRNAKKPDSYRAFSYPNFADLRGSSGVFAGVAAHNLAMVGITEGDSTRRLFTDLISSNYFDVMGVPLFRGRVFTAEEERPGSEMPVVIVSYSFWRRHGADSPCSAANCASTVASLPSSESLPRVSPAPRP